MANVEVSGWNAFVQIDALILQTIILVIVLYVLNKFLFQPYLKYLDEYSKKQTKIEEDYRNIDALVAAAEAEKKSILEDARKTSTSIISEAESLASKKRTAMLEKADAEVATRYESGKADLEKERLSMLSWAKAKMVDLVLKLNGKLFWEEKHSRDFLEKSIKDSDY